jgi:alpha-tubulin suppressor-like RCC1 family protein
MARAPSEADRTSPCSTPVPVAGNHTFVELSAGLDHACGIRSVTGTLLCWGQNDSGQLGRGNTSSANHPAEAAGGMAFRTLASGSHASCGLTQAGKAWCWGANNYGQSGNGGQIPYSNQFLSVPVAVAQGALVFHRLALGHHYACALTAGGEGYCWGANGNGQLGASAQNGSPTPIRAGGNLRAAEVAAAGIGTGSGAHTCAISKDRLTTWCWGLNDVGQLGNGNTTGPHAVNSAPTVVIGQAPG